MINSGPILVKFYVALSKHPIRLTYPYRIYKHIKYKRRPCWAGMISSRDLLGYYYKVSPARRYNSFNVSRAQLENTSLKV